MAGIAAGCLAMIVTITTSGGIGGFGLARSVEVRVEALPAPLQAEACDLLDPARLERLERTPPRGADFIVYHIRLVRDDAPAAEFDLAEPALPPETLDLIDTLLDQRAPK